MKKIVSLIAIVALLNVSTSYVLIADSFGPKNWHQYRMNSNKNAVFDNGSEPLDYQTFQTANQVRATPVVVGNKLFIGNHNSGDLFAFNVNTGEELWHSKAPNWIHSEMIYHNDKVFVGFGNRFFQDNGIRGTGENGVLALDAETGDILWKYNTEGEVMPTPAYYDGAIYAVTGDKHLYKLDPHSGELLHKTDVGSTVSMSSPNITGDTLYVGGSSPYTFSAYDLQNDKFKWQTRFPEVFSGLDDVPAAVSKNIVITTALEKSADDGKPEHFMYAMDTDSGEIIWKKSLGVGQMVKNNKSGAPMIFKGNVFVGSPITKTFYAFDLKTGEKLWEFKNEVMKAPPVAQGGVVYFSNTKGFVYALDTESGEILGEIELEGKLAPSGPVIINNTLFIGSQDSNVYAVPLTDIVDEEHHNLLNETKEGKNIYFWIIFVILLVAFTIIVVKKNKK